MAVQYLIFNGPMQTTASGAVVTTGTSIKTMLQFKPLVPGKIIEWGVSFDGSAAATPGKVELIETDVAATVTASVAADITAWNAEAIALNSPSTLMTLSTSGTGYTSTSEGSITAVRNLDSPKLIAGTNQYEKQFPLGREPYFAVGKFYRIRLLFGAAVNAYTYMIVEF